MRTNMTLSLLRDRQVALGTWLQLHSFQASRMLAAQGLFNWLLLDCEHAPVDRRTAAERGGERSIRRTRNVCGSMIAQRSRGLAVPASLGSICSAPSTAVEISKEVIVIERAELGTQVHIEIAFGKDGLDNGRRRLGNRWKRVRTPGHLLPPHRTTITLPDTRMEQ